MIACSGEMQMSITLIAILQWGNKGVEGEEEVGWDNKYVHNYILGLLPL